jgi:hypothetical protein
MINIQQNTNFQTTDINVPNNRRQCAKQQTPLCQTTGTNVPNNRHQCAKQQTPMCQTTDTNVPNNRHQCSANPHAVHEVYLQNLTVSNWCAVTVQKNHRTSTLKKKNTF